MMSTNLARRTRGIVRIAQLVMVAMCLGAEPPAFRQRAVASEPVAIEPVAVEIKDCLVRFARETRVPALETGRIIDLAVRENESVVAGQTLMRLDDAALVVARRAAQLQVESAGRDASDVLSIEYADVARNEAEAELDASLDVQREARGAVASNELRRLRLAVERTKLQVAQAKRQRERAQLEARLREAELSQIDAQLRNLYIDAPINGTVVSIDHQVGEWVNKGDTVATVAETSTLMVDALVDANAIPMHQAEGLAVSVHWVDSSDGRPRSLSGVIESGDGRWLSDRKYRIHARIQNEPRLSEHSRDSAGSQAKRAPRPKAMTVANRVSVGSLVPQPSSSSEATDWLLQPGRSVTLRIYRPKP